MPDWRDEVVFALDFWIGLEGGSAVTARWDRVGSVRAEARRGWFALDVRGSRTDADQLDTLRIAGKSVRPEDGYPVLEVVQEGQLIRFKVAEFVELADAVLWQYKQPATYLLTKLRDGIASLGDAGLGHDLAHGRLAAAPGVVELAGFTPAQKQAFASCFTPGVRLVWGPPGTGKTRVLTEAIDRLVAAGKRVLLVSSTNIAVDNALLGVVRQRRHSAGTLLRVGPPHLPEIAANPEVSLPHLVRQQLADVEEQRLALQAQLLATRETADELSVVEQVVAGFDPAEYARIRRLIEAVDAIPDLARAAAETNARRGEHDRIVAEARRRLQAAQAAAAEAEPARAAYAEVARLAAEVEKVASAADELGVQALLARQERDAVRAELARNEAAPLLHRLASPRRRTRLRADLATWQRHTDELDERERDARDLAERHRRSTQQRSAKLLAEAGIDQAEFAAREDALAEARRVHAAAAGALRDITAEQEAAQAALLRVEARPRPTQEQRAYVADADRRRLPEQHARLTMLRARVAADAGRRQELEKRHAQVQERFEKLRRDAEGEIITRARVVATTLARFRTTKALIDGRYDVVLVDEVSAATVPEVILAVSRGSRTALLLGDFMQLGAVLGNPQLERCERPDVQRWLMRDVFEHCGISTAAQAQAHPGCTALDVQHRFGRDVMDLANAIAYEGLLKPGTAVRQRPDDDPEIVLIDIDSLGDLARIRPTSAKAGWWPAGALLSRVLADYHLARGEVVGVVTPYRHQVEATLEALRDREGAATPQTEVGTAHRFQGREFPIVVFDLVEDQFDRRWMASAAFGKSSWERNGVRLFNVAVTRTQTRIYLIGSRAQFERAPAGTPLAAVAALIRQRRARTVPASLLITPPSVPAAQRPTLGPFSSDLVEVLAQHVRVADIHDERDFYRVFEDHLRAARRSVWIWAAWTAKRVESLLPILADARDRSVTVRVFVRDDRDTLQKKPEFQRHLTALRSVASSVVAVNMMHQKIVVIDDQTVLLGSLNVLSQHWTREVMLVMEGHHFARKLLEHEHATDFATPPRCGACGSAEIDLRRHKAGSWYWRCSARTCPAKRGTRAWTTDALPKQRTSKNRQPRQH